MQFIPTPNLGANEFSNAANKLRLNDDKGSTRIDINTTRYGTFSAYYFADNYNLDDPYPSGFGGATLPGPDGPYDELSSGRDQMIVLSNTKTFGSNLVNEAHIGYVRLNNNLGVPKGGVGVSLADQGISSGPQGIQQGFPQYAGVEMLYFNSFAVGTNPFFLAQVNNTIDSSNSVSKVVGNHTLKSITPACSIANCRIIRGKSDVSNQCTRENKKQKTDWRRGLDSNSRLRFPNTLSKRARTRSCALWRLKAQVRA